MTVLELQQRMGLDEFNHWQALYIREPWGEARDDLRALLMTTRGVPYPEDDFWKAPEPDQSPEEIKLALMRVTAAMG